MRAAAGFHPHYPFLRQCLTANQELLIFPGVNVVGDHADAVAVTQLLAECVNQGRFAGAYRAADADSEYGFSIHVCFIPMI